MSLWAREEKLGEPLYCYFSDWLLQVSSMVSVPKKAGQGVVAGILGGAPEPSRSLVYLTSITIWPSIPCNMGGVFQPTVQFPWLPSLPRALLRCARYLTSITRPALCIPRATRCNNLRAIPNRSSNVLAYQGLGRGWIPNRNWSMIRLRSQWWWSSTWSNVSKLTDCWVVGPVDSLDQLCPILKWDWIYFLKLPFILTIISSNRSSLCYGALL